MAIATYTGSIPSTIKKNKTWTLYSTSKPMAVSGSTTIGNPSTPIYYNNGYYYFGTNSGFIYTSADAKTWNVTAQVVTAQVNDIAYNGTIWVVISDNANEMKSSTDLVTWTSRTSAISGTSNLQAVKWIPAFNRFVCIGNPNAASWIGTSSSTDGITWTAGTANGQTVAWQTRQIAYDGTGTVVVNTSVSTTANGLYTTNGTTWTNTNMANGARADGSTLYYIGGSWNRFCYGSSYTQTASNLGTAWHTAPYTSFQGPHRYNQLRNANNGPYQQGIPIYNSIDNVYYVVSAYNSAPYFQPTLWTIDASTSVRTAFTTGTYDRYSLPVLHSETLPVGNVNATSNVGQTDITWGYGNGILVFAVYDTAQDAVCNIYSTAT